MVEFKETNPQFNPGLLSFTLEYLMANKWPSNSLMEDYNTCDEGCDIDQSEPCGCTCTTNPFEWTDDEVCLAGSLTAAPFAVWVGAASVEVLAISVRDGHGSVVLAPVEERAVQQTAFFRPV